MMAGALILVVVMSGTVQVLPSHVVSFPMTLGGDSFMSVEKLKAFSSGTANSAVRKGWAIPAQTLLI